MRIKMIEGSSTPSAHDDINSFLLDDDFRYRLGVSSPLFVNLDLSDDTLIIKIAFLIAAYRSPSMTSRSL